MSLPESAASSVNVRLCHIDDIEPNSAKRFDVAGHRVALVRFDDEVYALGDRCSHADYSLSEGEIDGYEKTIECPKHGSAFSVINGEPDSLPATSPVPTYGVEVTETGDVELIVDSGVSEVSDE